jgi:hypothetical protein
MVNVMLFVTAHNLLSKRLTSHFTPNTFIASSGATYHMQGSLEGMFNLKPHVTDIMVGNNDTMSSVSKGDYKGLVMQKDGSSFEVTLQDVLYIPKLMVNLFSLTKAPSTKVPIYTVNVRLLHSKLFPTRCFLIKKINMVQDNFWALKYIHIQIILQYCSDIGYQQDTDQVWSPKFSSSCSYCL